MPSALKDFYLNEAMRSEVRLYLMKCLEEEALKRLFDEDSDAPVYGFAEAKTIIDQAFDKLETLFTPKSEGKPQQSPR